MGSPVPDYVSFVIATDGTEVLREKRFPTTITVANLKMRLELITGASTNSMQLELRRADGTVAATLEDNGARLESLPVANGLTLYVSDPHLNHCNFQDPPFNERHRISEELYNQRTDTARRFLQGLRVLRPEVFDVWRRARHCGP
ncbi:tubulin-specific chaperone B-like [Ornithodoros turicata]|uniref:tubulin-specific chaperone B-like n=1 Tax=Ornithodoros turicata TaxID=34597 RepID=UPI0031393F3E